MKEKNRKTKKIIIILGIIAAVIIMGGFIIKAILFPHYEGRPVTGQYQVVTAEAILVDRSRVDSFEDDGTYCEVPVHFYYPDAADAREKFPLVVFSHGAFGFYKSNYSTYMELASNGYVVVALDHPHHSFFTKNTEGKTVTVDTEFFNNAMRINEVTTTEQEIFDLSAQWLSLRTADVNFAIDTFEGYDGKSAFSDSWYFADDYNKEMIMHALIMTDFDEIGLMGHSLGGATAEMLGRSRSDISAVIDLDGTMLGANLALEPCAPFDFEGKTYTEKYIINEEPYPVPILNIDNDEHHFSRVAAKEIDMPYSNNVVMDNAIEGYDTYFAKSGHMNFTDLPMFSPVLAGLLGKGEIDAEYCIDETNGLVLEFFNAKLKAEGSFNVKDCYGN